MKSMKRWHMAVVAAGVLALGVTGAAQKVQITGAGATFPNPIYSKWFSEYNKLHPNVEINYQSLGSGAGIRQITAGTVFFGATDGPMTNDQLLAAPGKILHFPTVLGGRAGVQHQGRHGYQVHRHDRAEHRREVQDLARGREQLVVGHRAVRGAEEHRARRDLTDAGA